MPYDEGMLTDDDKQWILERLQELEVKLKNESQKWTTPFDARQRSHTASLHACEAEIEALSDRLKKLEGRS